MPTLCIEGLEFTMNVKDKPKFERLNKLNTGGQQCGINIFELTGTVLTPIHMKTNYDQRQIVLLLYQNYYYLITKWHCLINKNSNLIHVCRRCLTAFSSQPVLVDLIDRCQKQKPTDFAFSYKIHLKFKDHHMKVLVPIRIYAVFECFNQPQNTAKLALHDSNVLFKKIPIALGYHRISPFGNQYYSYFGEGCVKWFVNEMLTLEKIANNYFKTNLEL